MTRITFTFLFTLSFLVSYSQTIPNPGNIGETNLTAWFKATDLALGDVTSWETTFSNTGAAITLADNTAPYAQATNIGTYSNYNMAVDFKANDVNALKVLEINDALDLLDNTSAGGTGTFLAAYYLPQEAICSGCHVVNYREATSGTVDGIQFRAKLDSGIGRIAIGTGNSDNASRDYTQDFIPDIISYNGNRSGPGTMSSYRRSLLFTGGVSSATTGQQGLYFGARKFNGTEYNAPFDGLIYEVIFYSTDLTASEYARVHTYLAVKYGTTLDNTGGDEQGDYVATDGSIVWDASDNPEYHNNVIGLAREDSEDLLQKQSHTLDDTSRIYLNSLATSNIDNTGNFASDISYIMMGHNNDLMCGTVTSNMEIPADTNIYARIAREWKIANTNFTETFNNDFVLNACAGPGSVVVEDIRLLIDDDGDFTDATVYPADDNLEFTYSNGVITVAGISNTQIPNNETRYMTIAFAEMPVIPSSLGSLSVRTLHIYPNPTGSEVIVEGPEEEMGEIRVYDVLGREVSSLISINWDGGSKVLIDLSSLNSGVYMLRTKGMLGFVFKE